MAVTERTGNAVELFLRPPADIDACRKAAEETLQRKRPWRELADAIGESSRSYGVPETALSRLESLASGNAVMVVTGQQVGYLGGPLYTFLKAYHATRLASELEKKLEIPVLPLFWLEGRDHDLTEVRDAHCIGRNGDLLTLRYEPEEEIAGYEVGLYRVLAGEHLQELAAATDPIDSDAFDALSRAYSDTTLAQGLGRLLATTLGPRGLLLIEGMDPRLKAQAAPLWEKVIDAGPRLAEIFSKRAKELLDAGWAAPMSPTPDAYLFYVARDHRRSVLTYAGELKHPDGHTERLSNHDLQEIVRRNLDAISPKAALRPPYQDYILPTVAYVAGPGEMDYQAQLTPFYREFGIPAPSLFPRLSATIIDAKTRRLLEKQHLTVGNVLGRPAKELAREVLREEDEGHTARLFDETRTGIESLYHRLSEAISKIDPTLAGAAQTTAGKALHPLDHLREKTERALKQRYSVSLSRLEKLLNVLRPQDKLAERVLSGGYYLCRFGTENLLSALDELPVQPTEHFVLTLE